MEEVGSSAGESFIAKGAANLGAISLTVRPHGDVRSTR